MKVMKKLLIGAVCILTFAVSACAVNGDGDNDQNDDLNHAIVNMDDDERSLESQLQLAINTYSGETTYESDGILNDTIIPLIRQGANITDDENIFGVCNLVFLSRVVFYNSRYDELPDDVKNRILGESLLYYVENRTHGVDEILLPPFFVDPRIDNNYNIIKKLLKLHAPININFLDNEGRTVLDIVENRNNLWENGTYNLADDPEFSSFYENHGGLIGGLKLHIRDRLESAKPDLKKHDQKVYKLITRYISRNQDS